jgi:hypothetical protein
MFVAAHRRCDIVFQHERRRVWVPAFAGTTWMGRSSRQSDYKIGKIAPFRVVGFDKPDLPVPIPFLQLLLARDRLIRSFEALDLYKAKHAVLPNKFRTLAGAVLGESLAEVVGYADVDGAVAATGEKIDVVQFRLSQRVVPAKAGTQNPRRS